MDLNLNPQQQDYNDENRSCFSSVRRNWNATSIILFVTFSKAFHIAQLRFSSLKSKRFSYRRVSGIFFYRCEAILFASYSCLQFGFRTDDSYKYVSIGVRCKFPLVCRITNTGVTLETHNSNVRNVQFEFQEDTIQALQTCEL